MYVCTWLCVVLSFKYTVETLCENVKDFKFKYICASLQKLNAHSNYVHEVESSCVIASHIGLLTM